MVYPIAVGIVSAAHKIPLEPALHGFFHAVVSNWISAGSRLIPLGQTDSQRVLARLEPAVIGHAKRAREASLDDLGSATFRADLASLRHETQYTRLFGHERYTLTPSSRRSPDDDNSGNISNG